MITVIVATETMLLVLLVVLVAGLLRSHAELLRRLGPADSESLAHPAASPVRAPGDGPAPALAGATPSGGAVALSFQGSGAPTLLAFLTSGCSSCARFWATLGEERLPPDVRTVIVTHGAERERPARLAALAPAGLPVVMSSRAWDDYGVPGAPYFVLVDGGIRGEGVATGWPALASLVSDAIEDHRGASSVDETLAAAGIGPEHPSLYPRGAA